MPYGATLTGGGDGGGDDGGGEGGGEGEGVVMLRVATVEEEARVWRYSDGGGEGRERAEATVAEATAAR